MPLKELYADDFRIGTCLSRITVGERYRSAVLRHFGSITCENETKPEAVLDCAASRLGAAGDPAYVALCFDRCAGIVGFCAENGLKLRLHTFVWHSQTPEWFFHEDYDESRPLAGAELMARRLKNFISAQVRYFDEHYPGLVYAIDVVNEAFNGSAEFSIKDTGNRWYDTMGVSYIYYAFLYARAALERSASMRGVRLVYNDYDMINKADTVLTGLKGLFARQGKDVHDYVDAIGMQGHIDTDTSAERFADAARLLASGGYEVQVTELDIGIPGIPVGTQPTRAQLEEQGRSYKRLMECLRALVREGVPLTCVSLWGISDDTSWRRSSSKGFNAYAALYDGEMAEKPALRGMGLAEDIAV